MLNTLEITMSMSMRFYSRSYKSIRFDNTRDRNNGSEILMNPRTHTNISSRVEVEPSRSESMIN